MESNVIMFLMSYVSAKAAAYIPVDLGAKYSYRTGSAYQRKRNRNLTSYAVHMAG